MRDDGAVTGAGPHGPGIRFPPPFLFAGGLGVAALLQGAWPLPLWREPRPITVFPLAYALLLAGLAWMAWGLITFRRARTSVLPHRPAARLVTGGPYRYGRNPMYLGMSGVYWGVALWLNTLWAPLLFPLVIVLLHRLVIRREERYLAAAFGAEYDDYRGRVSRWLSPPR